MWKWLLSAIAVFGAWEIASRLGKINILIFSTPSAIGNALWHMAASGELWPHLAATALALFVGLGLALLAIPLGIYIGTRSPETRRFMERWIDRLNEIPYPALVVVFLVVLGVGFWQKTVTVFWRAVFPTLYFAIGLTQSFLAPGGENRLQVEAGRSLGGNDFQVTRFVIFPLVLPELIRSIRLSIGGAIRAVLVAEITAGSTGLGFLVINYQQGYQMAKVFASIFVATILGTGLTTLLIYLEHKAARWRYLDL